MTELTTLKGPRPRTPISRGVSGILAVFTSKVSFGFMTLRDIGFWMTSARTDAELSRLQASHESQDAFEHLYRTRSDPWAAAQCCYSYQRIKYRKALSLLPKRRFQSALDIGCGVGEFTRHIAKIAGTVRGIDISVSAVKHAHLLSTEYPNITFAPGNVRELEASPSRTFDLVVLADVLYYLRPFNVEQLDELFQHVAAQVQPGGTLLLTNHCFFHFDEMSRWVRQAHVRAARLHGFEVFCERWRPFFLTTVLQRSRQPSEREENPAPQMCLDKFAANSGRTKGNKTKQKEQHEEVQFDNGDDCDRRGSGSDSSPRRLQAW